MELKVNIGFEQLLKAINQLPAAKIIQLQAELSAKKTDGKRRASTDDFQKFLLTGPVMNDHQYDIYKATKTKLRKWRTK